MTDYKKIYTGITKAIWGYFFIYFNININSVSLLPSFVGYLLFLSAIDCLKDEERELSLLHTLGVIMSVWCGAEWIASWIAIDLDGKMQIVDIIICVVNLYFHFQLLTNLASIARKYQSEGYGLDTKLLRYRTLQTVMLTVVMILRCFSGWLTEIWVFVSVGMVIAYIVAGVCLMRALYVLRKCIPTDIGAI